MKNRRFKMAGSILAATMITTLSMGTVGYASPQAREVIESDGTSVDGGNLWCSWKDGKTYRANYDHSSKTHKCTAKNRDGDSSTSSWESKNTTARSGWIAQTLWGNKAYADTK